MLQICIGSICLVSATPPTVLGQSFWNFTGTLQLSFDFTWEISHLLDITAVAGHLAWLAVLFLIKSSSKLLVTRTDIKARMSLISGLWFPWPIYMFLKWDLTLAHWTQVSDRCPLGYLLMLRYPRITYVFKCLVGFGLLSCISSKSIKIIKSAVLTQLYDALLNDCTFLLIHKVKYCMVTRDFVLMILQYTWQKRKPHIFFLTLHSCQPIWHTQGLGLSSKASARPYLRKFYFHPNEEWIFWGGGGSWKIFANLKTCLNFASCLGFREYSVTANIFDDYSEFLIKYVIFGK